MEQKNLIGKRILYKTLTGRVIGTVMSKSVSNDECWRVQVITDERVITAVVNVRDIIKVFDNK